MTENPLLENYERAYARMWEEVQHARNERDRALQLVDCAHDLIIELSYLIDKGELRLTGRAFEAFVRFSHHFAPEWDNIPPPMKSPRDT